MRSEYLMESDEEAYRLDVKTDPEAVRKQAVWAGLKPGMSVADLGCGSGKTTSVLNDIVQPGGRAMGLDFSENRIDFAMRNYGERDMEFKLLDIREPLEGLGQFDFIWVRFVLEYYLRDSFDIVRNIAASLKPGGILCLADLDHNCLSHYGLSPRLENTVAKAMDHLMESVDFDPYAGRKLYSYLYDLGFEDMDVRLEAHHLIFGALRESDSFNWLKKVEMLGTKMRFVFDEYEGGHEEFIKEFKEFFRSHRRFTYTPLITCRGRKAG
jgi:SAM-dependent methyltransferase